MALQQICYKLIKACKNKDWKREKREREKQIFSIAVIFPFLEKAEVILVAKGIFRALWGRPKKQKHEKIASHTVPKIV